jgi:subfamily B ATP-binding cassette protein MsbA
METFINETNTTRMQLKEFFHRFYPYLKKHIFKLVVVSLTMIISTSIQTALPEITGQMVDNLFKNDDKSNALFYSFLVFGVLFSSAIFAFISTNISSSVAGKIVATLRTEMFAKLLQLPKTYFDTHDSGKILSKLTFDTEQVASVASTLWISLIQALLTVVVLTIYLFWSSWQLSLSLVIVLPLIFLSIHATSKRIKHASSMVQHSMGEATSHIGETITNNAMVKIYQLFTTRKQKFRKLANTIRLKNFRSDNISALNTLVINTLIGICLGLVVYFSATSLNMSAGEFMAFFGAMAMLIKPAKTLVSINKPLQKALAAGESIFGLLDEKSEKSGNTISQITGAIEFKNVSFSYHNKPVLTDISFTINQGESLALVGATGSGKSTIAALVSRFYEVDSGDILIDGINIKDINLTTLRENIALVEQRVNLFTGTILENISHKDLTDSEIQTTLQNANAITFVQNLEDGVQSTIGNNGVSLSGGQAQRLSIARAIAKNAPILILDEATSALDSNTEKEVQEALQTLQTGKTTLIIAHRLSTIKHAHKIAVVKDGKIAEIGSHDELLKLRKEYYHLYQKNT